MKNLKKTFQLLALVISLALVAPDFIPAINNTITVEAAKAKLNKTKISLDKGKTYTLKLKNNKKSIKWSTKNSKIATVTSKGKVTAKKAGTTTITAKVGKKKYTCTITVTEALGSKANPISAYNSNIIKMLAPFQQKETFKLKLTKYLEGTEAEKLLTSYASDIPSDYVWVYMEFDSERKSDILLMNLFSYQNFFDSKCKTQLSDGYMITTLSNNSIRPITSVDPYVKYKATFYILCAVPKSTLPLTFRLSTGYNQKTRQYTYTWFTTEK